MNKKSKIIHKLLEEKFKDDPLFDKIDDDNFIVSNSELNDLSDFTAFTDGQKKRFKMLQHFSMPSSTNDADVQYIKMECIERENQKIHEIICMQTELTEKGLANNTKKISEEEFDKIYNDNQGKLLVKFPPPYSSINLPTMITNAKNKLKKVKKP